MRKYPDENNAMSYIKDHWNNEYHITTTAPIHFIMMFSPAASSLATRVGGGVGPFAEKYRY